ncbi:MAG: hypothetical protein PHO15_10160, partial [Eubacteriales bacterium]|nr:hypothetical protein [Eubacteriales bacterium]
MKNNDFGGNQNNGSENKIHDTNQAAGNSKKDLKQEKMRQKELERQQIKDIRAKNEKQRLLDLEQKKERKAKLGLLSDQDRKAYLKTEKEGRLNAKNRLKAQNEKRKKEYAALSPTEKKAYNKQRAAQIRLQKKARKSYMPLLVLKYVLLAALAGVLVYA